MQSRCDMDPSTVYQTEEGKLVYNDDAKDESHREWKDEFEDEE